MQGTTKLWINKIGTGSVNVRYCTEEGITTKIMQGNNSINNLMEKDQQ